MTALGLVGRTSDGPVSLPSVADAVRSLTDAADIDAPAPAPQAPGAPASAPTRGISAITELLLSLSLTPARELGRGGFGLPEQRRIGAAIDTPAEFTPALIALADRAGLVARDPAGWIPTELGDIWLRRSALDRWLALAVAWRTGIDAELTALVTETPGTPLLALGTWAYPASVERPPQAIRTIAQQAEVLGLLDHPARTDDLAGGALTPLALDLLGGADVAANVAALLPEPVQGVYLQHDLSLIVPGILRAETETTLREFADLESRAEASTYRITETSVFRGLTAGLTTEQIRAFLTEISLTGIPQPVGYLLDRAGERFGSVVVAEGTPQDGRAAHGILRTRTPELLDQILVDRTLHGLSLIRRSPTEAVSSFESSILYWALVDAKYPALAVSADGSPRRLRRRRFATPARAATPETYAVLLERLQGADSASADQGDEAWLQRRLGVALRTRETLVVTVTLPDRGDVDFVLEPTGLGGGRVRGIDKAAETERTLPLARITRVATFTP